MNKKLPLYLQSCLHFFKVNFRPHTLAFLSFLLFSLTAFSQGPGCPNVYAGDDIELDCDEDCTDLSASFLETGETTSYEVSAIPYEPPFPFTGGTPVSVDTDDVWSDAIDLPFDFCFFGETYSEMVIGSNAVISFDLNANAPGGYCTWSFDESVPDPGLFTTAIFGPYMDVDPSIAGSGLRTGSFTVDLGGDQDLCEAESYDITAEITDGDPTEATFLWSTGETTQTITVNTSDTYTVDVTIGTCTLIASVDINFNELPLFNLGNDIETCFAEPLVLDASPSNYDPTEATYEWSMDGEILVEETSSTLLVNEIGTYAATVSAGGCTATDSVVVSFNELEVSVGDDFQTCPKEPHTLTATTNESGATYQWFLNGSILSGETNSTLDIVIDEGSIGTQTYSVEITANGCTGTDSVDVSLYDVANCVISQGISPNNDGYNDTLDLNWLNDRTGIVKLKIYNRWGTLVFYQRNYSDQWGGQSDKGNDLPTGTYFYVIDFKKVDAVYGGQTTGWIYLNRKAN